VKPLDEWYQKDAPRFIGSSGVLLWAGACRSSGVWRRNFWTDRTAERAIIVWGTVADSSGPVRLADEIERMVVCGPRTFIDLSSTTTFVLSRTPKTLPHRRCSSGGIGAAA